MTFAAPTCKFAGTNRKFKNWNGTQIFQFATTVGNKSCFNLFGNLSVLPSIANKALKNVAKNTGANANWSKPNRTPAPREPPTVTIFPNVPYQKCNAGPTKNAPKKVNVKVRFTSTLLPSSNKNCARRSPNALSAGVARVRDAFNGGGGGGYDGGGGGNRAFEAPHRKNTYGGYD